MPTHPKGTPSWTPPARTDSSGWAETSQRPAAEQGHPPVGMRTVGQEMAPGPDQVPQSSPTGAAAVSTRAPRHPPARGKGKGINGTGTEIPQPGAPQPAILSHCGDPHPLRPPQTPGRRASRQRASHLPRLLARREAKSEKLSPAPWSPCRGQEGQAAPSSSAVRPGRLGRAAALPAPRQPGGILRSSLCAAVKYSSPGLSF